MINVDLLNYAEVKEAIAKYGADFMPRVRFALAQFLNKVADVARTKVPVDTGHLQTSLKGEITKATDNIIEGRVGTNVKYGPYVELGTGIYGPAKRMIVPRNKRVLAWVTSGARPTSPAAWKQAQQEGRVVIARRVRGMKPRPFLLPALNETMDQLYEFIKKVLK